MLIVRADGSYEVQVNAPVFNLSSGTAFEESNAIAINYAVSDGDFDQAFGTLNVVVNDDTVSLTSTVLNTATLDDEALAINKDLHYLLKGDPREEIVVDRPMFSKRQADDAAMAILKDRQKEMVKASATCVGLPSLVAGTKVQIDGVGARFSGVYFITATTHAFGDSGYTTRFEARRDGTGSLEGVQ